MEKNINEEIQLLKKASRRINLRIKELQERQGKIESRVERFLKGDVELSAKGFISRIEDVEKFYKQFETITKMFEIGEKVFNFLKYVWPFIVMALAYMHYNMDSTSAAVGK